MGTESGNGNNQWEMPGEGHHAMYRLSLYQNALRNTFCSAFCKKIETL